MQLRTVESVKSISGNDFRENYYFPQLPLVVKDLAKEWPAYAKWNWNYFKSVLGHIYVGIHNNTKTHNYFTNENPNDHTTIGRYIDMIRHGPSAWRIFLFNILSYAPKLVKDFTWPEYLMEGFGKRPPLLYAGGQGSVTHMHYDADMSNLLHTQFLGRKRILLFAPTEKYKLYSKPFEISSMVDFTKYYDLDKSKVDWQKFLVLKYARGYEVILEHGDTLFIPSGYWHHAEYLESGVGMSLRSAPTSFVSRCRGLWNINGMRNIDLFMRQMMPEVWENWKNKQIIKTAEAILRENSSEIPKLITT
jgi:hypothetical protein